MRVQARQGSAHLASLVGSFSSSRSLACAPVSNIIIIPPRALKLAPCPHAHSLTIMGRGIQGASVFRARQCQPRRRGRSIDGSRWVSRSKRRRLLSGAVRLRPNAFPASDAEAHHGHTLSSGRCAVVRATRLTPTEKLGHQAVPFYHPHRSMGCSAIPCGHN